MFCVVFFVVVLPAVCLVISGFLNFCRSFLKLKVFLCLIQSYIQSFRDRQVQAQPFPGRLVGGPTTVVDVGYDCGSAAPLTGAAGPLLRV